MISIVSLRMDGNWLHNSETIIRENKPNDNSVLMRYDSCYISDFDETVVIIRYSTP